MSCFERDLLFLKGFSVLKMDLGVFKGDFGLKAEGLALISFSMKCFRALGLRFSGEGH